MSEEKIAFEKAKFEFLKDMNEKENERKENLEKKAQFYLSLNIIILGAFLFKTDIFNYLKKFLNHCGITPFWKYSTIIALLCLGVFILASLVGILFAISIQKYLKKYPNKPSNTLFEPDSSFIVEEKREILYRKLARGYAFALESSSNQNEKKAKWAKISAFCILVSASILVLILIEIMYFNLKWEGIL